MKKIYFTLREVDNEECPNIGTIGAMIKGANIVNDIDTNNKIKEAIENHFDAEMLSSCEDIDLTQAYNAYPVRFEVEIDNNFEKQNVKIEVEQTWLY